MALGIAEPPLHGPEIGGSGKDVHARIAAATLAGWMKIQRLYAKHATRAWISGVFGEPDVALAQLERDGFIWRDTQRWDHYGIAAMTPGWIERRFAEAGLVGLATRRRECSDTHSYKVGRKPR